MASPTLSVSLQVDDLPLGHTVLGTWGPRGPAVNVLDTCPEEGVIFIANGCNILAFQIDELRQHAAGTGSASHSGVANSMVRTGSRHLAEGNVEDFNTLRPCLEVSCPAPINRLRCGKLACFRGQSQAEGRVEEASPVCVAVGDDGLISAIDADTSHSKQRRTLAKWHNGTSTWGLAVGSSHVVVSANDHCVKALEVSLSQADVNSMNARSSSLTPGWVVMRGHKGNLPCVDISPDNSEVASASLDGTLRTWDLSSGQARASLCCGASWGVLYLELFGLRPALTGLPFPSSPGTLRHVASIRSAANSLKPARRMFCRVARVSGLLFSRLGCCLPRRQNSIVSTEAASVGSIISLSSSTVHEPLLPDLAESPISEDLLSSHVLPFLTAGVIVRSIVSTSRSLQSAAELELRSPHRREWMLLHIGEANLYLRSAALRQERARLKMPFSGAFAHASWCADLSLVFLSSAAHSRAELWVLRVERKPCTLACGLRPLELRVLSESAGVRILGHAVLPRLPENDRTLEMQGELPMLFVLLSSRQLLGFKLMESASTPISGHF